ncbi:MAG: A/G-specific adenine glycosylase [Pseudohongiellaceae bacterium]
MSASFAHKLLAWYDEHGRHDLPWQINSSSPSPYSVWVSEVMLQQTQVSTVIPYYERFMARYPDVAALAAADVDQVLHLWTGLGYYARARNLHRAAAVIMDEHGGTFPQDVEQLAALPGIGRSTAGAIAALAMNIRAPILDGNVKRVLSRVFAIAGYPEQSQVKNTLWQLAESLLPHERVADYTQAIMDLGSLVCTRKQPLCAACPLQSDCKASKADAVDKLPERKPSRQLPVKSVTMFIVQNETGAVLLEKRPPSGVWGSLYSFPETPGNSKQQPELPTLPIQANRKISTKSPALPPMRHTFSHYHLDIQPLRLQASATPEVAESKRWLWYPLDNSVEVGLAAPVKKLLNRLADEQTP